MKRIFLILTGVVIFGVLVYSCSKDEAEVSESENIVRTFAFHDMNGHIAALNAHFDLNPQIETRGRFWRWFKRVFLCDLGGAALGAGGGAITSVVGGIWGSIMGGITGGHIINPQNGKSLMDCYIDSGNVAANAGSDSDGMKYDAVDSIGYLHNVIISEIYEELGETIYSVNHDDLLQLVCSKVETYYGIIPKDVREELRLVTEQVKLVADTFCDFTVENPYAELEEILPDFKEEVKVLKNYGEAIDELSTDAELVASYTREFRKIVDQAQIPEKSKELINTAVVVGGNSAVLWRVENGASTGRIDSDKLTKID